MNSMFIRESSFVLDEDEEDLEMTCSFYLHQFRLLQHLIDQNKFIVLNERPKEEYFKDQRCFAFRREESQDLQVIKRLIFPDFSSVYPINSTKILMTYKSIRFIEAKSKTDQNFRVRLVKKLLQKPECQNEREEDSFIYVHFFRIRDEANSLPSQLYSPFGDQLSTMNTENPRQNLSLAKQNQRINTKSSSTDDSVETDLMTLEQFNLKMMKDEITVSCIPIKQVENVQKKVIFKIDFSTINQPL